MARVTRSKKAEIDIAEDNTAFASPNPRFQDNNVAQENQLTVMNSTNAMPDPIAAELKGLKAAYRTAIGGKKSRKPRKNKMDSAADGNEGANGMGAGAGPAIHLVPEATRQLLQSQEGSLISLLERNPISDLTEPLEQQTKEEQHRANSPMNTGRTTRRQAAKVQAGQYIPYNFYSKPEPAPSAGRPVEYDFITSLFGGRFLGSRYGRVMADQHNLAKEETLSKAREHGRSLKDLESTPQFETSEAGSSKDGALVCDTTTNLSHVMPFIHTPLRSPTKTLDEVEQEQPVEPATCDASVEDSFVEQIIARSPAKHVSRIEDSVEALDELEDALEALDQATLAESMVSPEKTRVKDTSPTRQHTAPLESSDKAKTGCNSKLYPAKPTTTKSGYSSMRVKSTAPKAPVVKKATSMFFKSTAPGEHKPIEEKAKIQPKTTATTRPMSMYVGSKASEDDLGAQVSKRPIKRPVSLLPPRETVKSSKPVTKATFELPGEAIARRLKEQREARLAQRKPSDDNLNAARAISGPKIRSTKPLTTSTFELPGEALSRRKREAHEARLKAQEEEERKRREFKAKPLRKSTIPNVAPRETIASRARQSRIGLENIFESNGTLNSGRSGSPKAMTIGANVGAHRPSIAKLISANISAPRAPGPAPSLTRTPSTTTASGISMSGRAMQRTVSADQVQVQRQRAKEIYNRDARLAEDIERERREREAAAKRAREEAAERGRQASREWAERQLVKKLGEGDKGISAGYGPGGQLGLRG